ncbi:diphosphomevalonate decarboxylase-like [Ruditapes philippinarum]|uniref:diphosphomevalonate decarboxylase-like n=1 Tax=Ruditapes philippinarum TaxID=129788 RepID=UPI00295BAA73|nr:diphosphomevalonate decarboxylase-like [Ruditapes philippinarum]
MKSVTCTAPVNIAVVKYWGKRDENLVLPLNSSVSVTLSQDQLRAKTTICACEHFTENKIWLNGREDTFESPRIQNLLKEVKNRAKQQGDGGKILDWKIHICSENNFPTAAGLASSAAGYACLAFTLARLYRLEGDISDIARRGSGSACRSVHGGFVVWDKGDKDDGTDSISRQIAPHTHWPDLHVLILVVSDKKKHIGSSEGMQTTVRSSELMLERVRQVPKRVDLISNAILSKDFDSFATHTMKESNQLHAVCLDTYPPISYLTDVSRQVITLVHAYNKYCGQNKVAYTFDAGPNACLYLLEENVAMVTALIKYLFPPEDVSEHFVTGLPVDEAKVPEDFISTLNLPIQQGAIKYMIHTVPGDGPQVLTDNDECLLNENGDPNYLVPEKRKIDCVS